MPSKRFLSTAVFAASLLSLVGCGGVTQFQGGSAFAINGTPPAPPPPPPPKEEVKAPPARVELRDNKIEFKEKIQFEVAKSTIKPESYGLLKEIADVIKKNPQVKKISIEGHASAEGDAKQNKTLSDSRAKSVMEHLKTKEGVDGARMIAKGWGIEKPIAPNDTEENREKNRRVEFLVVEQDVTQKKVEIDPTTGKEKVVGSTTNTVSDPNAAGGNTTAAKPADPKAPPPKGLPKKPEVKK